MFEYPSLTKTTKSTAFIPLRAVSVLRIAASVAKIVRNGHVLDSLAACFNNNQGKEVKKIKFAAMMGAIAVLQVGCGGGGAENDGERANDLSVDLAMVDTLTQHCNVKVPAVAPGASYQIDYVPTQSLGTKFVGRGSAMSAAGSGFEGDGEIRLSATLKDYRGMTTGNYMVPVVANDAKLVMLFPDLLGNKAVACLQPVTQWERQPKPPAGPFSDGYDPNKVTIVWKDRRDVSLPIKSLPGHAIDGFELSANFVPRDGITTFFLPKNVVEDPSPLSICRWAEDDKVQPWSCMVPEVTNGSSYWTASISGVKPGVYVLISKKANTGE